MTVHLPFYQVVADSTRELVRRAPAALVIMGLFFAPSLAILFAVPREIEYEWALTAWPYLQLWFGVLAAGGFAHVVIEGVEGRHAGVPAAISAIGQRIGGLAGAGFVALVLHALVDVGLGLVGGSLLGSVAVLGLVALLGCALFVLEPVIMAEKVDIFGALARSWSLTRGHLLRLLLLMAVVVLLALHAGLAIALLERVAPPRLVWAAIIAVGLVLAAFGAALKAHVYLALRDSALSGRSVRLGSS